jgi:methyl coenzyme M reductase subunit C
MKYNSVLTDSYRLFEGNCYLHLQGSTRTVMCTARIPSCLICSFPVRRNHFATQPILAHD